MKTKPVLVLVCLVLSCIGLNAQNLRGDGLKSSIVKYEMKAQNMQLPMVEYKDDYGKKICTKMTVMGSEIGYVINEDKSYMINYSQRQYMEIDNPQDPIDYNEMTPEMIKKYNIVATGTGEFLGKKCTIYTAEIKETNPEIKTTSWVYKGIPLKMVSEYGNGKKDERVATSIEENPNIDPAIFAVPTGFSKMEVPMMQ